MAFVNVNGNSVWVDNPQYDSEGNVTNAPTSTEPAKDYWVDDYGNKIPNMFNWVGPETPEGQTFTQFADYLYANGLAGQDYNDQGTFINTIQKNGWLVPLALATAGAGMGLAGGAAAAEGAGVGALETTGAGGLAGGGGFVPAAGSGASFGIDAGATYGLAGATAPLESGAGGLAGGGGFTPSAGSGANFAIDPTAAYTTAGTPSLSAPIGDQPGDYPMPGENGTASQWTPSNINPNDVTKLLDYNVANSQSTSLADALKTANQVKQGVSTANSLAKMLSQSAGSGLSNSLGQLAKGANSQGQALTPFVRGNTNPFTYTAQQPIQNAQPMDLSALSKLLRQG